jgi:hypothetical protein
MLQQVQVAGLRDLGDYLGIIAITLAWLIGIAMVMTAIFKGLMLADGRQRNESGWATISGLFACGIVLLNVQGFANAVSATFFGGSNCQAVYDFSRWMYVNGGNGGGALDVVSSRCSTGSGMDETAKAAVAAALHFFTAYGIISALRGIMTYRHVGSVTGKGSGGALTLIIAGVFLGNVWAWIGMALDIIGMGGVRQQLGL